MTMNISRNERAIRGAGSIALFAVAMLGGYSETTVYVLFTVALILMLTALAGYCPIYRLVGRKAMPGSGSPVDSPADGRQASRSTMTRRW